MYSLGNLVYSFRRFFPLVNNFVTDNLYEIFPNKIQRIAEDLSAIKGPKILPYEQSVG